MQSNVEFLPIAKEKVLDVIESNRLSGWPDVDAQTKVFLHEYSVVGSLKNACEKVGVSKDRGSRMLRDPVASAFLEELQEHLSVNTIITRSFVELQMLETLEQCNGDVDVPHVTKDGDIVWGPSFNASGKIALLKEMKGLAGMNKDIGTDGNGVTIHIDLHAAGYTAPLLDVVSEQ